MKIALCGPTFPAARGVLAPLLPGDEVVVLPPDGLKDAAAAADVLVPMMASIDAGVVDATSARLIQQWGAGLEGVDIDAASRRGIYVANVPSDVTANAESTAEHALLLMLGAARRLRTSGRSFEDGQWGVPVGEALFGRRALIVGFGRIGKALARRLAVMGMVVDAVRRTPEPDEAILYGVNRVGTPDDLLRFAPEADFVVCTAAATGASRGMLNRGLFRAMKRTAFFVNVSRGSIVEESDLVAALRDGTIAGAGLDVFAEEPVPRDHPLLAMEQVLATPHIAGVTMQSYEGIARTVAANVRRLKAGEPPAHCVNLKAVVRSS